MSSNLLKLDLGFNRPKIFSLLEVAVYQMYAIPFFYKNSIDFQETFFI